MIHTNELMLGNCVELGNGNYVKITGITDISCSYVDSKTNEAHVCSKTSLHGIPITEELLEKCGFIRSSLYDDGGNCFFIGLLKSWIIDGEMLLKAHCIDSEFTKINREMAVSEIYKIHFLHELQNAYFMLTKKHLEIKL